MAKNKKTAERIDDIKSEVLSKLNILDEYKLIGLVTSGGDHPRDSGWISAHALGRDDKSPSAAIHSETGVYKDSSGIGTTISFWDAMAKFGKHLDWLKALEFFANQTGVKLPEKIQTSGAFHQVEMIGELRQNTFHGLRKYHYPELSLETLNNCGCRHVAYPANSSTPYECVAWPVYGPKLTDQPNRGWVLQHTFGKSLHDAQGNPHKRLSVGTGSGLLNWQDLEKIRQKKAKVVIKVEGISDMMALLAIRPASKSHVAIITNACGAHESLLPTEVASVFKDLHLVILHDADQAGQSGAEKWVRAATPFAKTIRNVRLFEEITPKQGRDVRDWIAQGGTWEQLEKLINSTAHSEAQLPAQSQAEIACEMLGITVLGTASGKNDIVILDSLSRRRTFKLRDLDEFTIRQLVSPEKVQQHLRLDADPEPTPNKITIPQFKAMVAELSFRDVVDGKNLRGDGIWKAANESLMIVKKGACFSWNGKEFKQESPLQKTHTYDLSGNDWFDTELLQNYLEEAQRSPVFVQDTFEEIVALFARWPNWKYSDSPEMLAGLLIATFLQSTWRVRPMVGIEGQSSSGKSRVRNLVHELMGPAGIFISGSTEAAIRNQIGNTSRMVYLDEFDSNTSKRELILQLLRTSTTGDTISRATASQEVKTFGLKHITWISAIELGLTEATDMNRFMRFELNPLPDDSKEPPLPSHTELFQLRNKFFALAIFLWKKIFTIQEQLLAEKIPGYHIRLVEITGIPASVLAAVYNEDETQFKQRIIQYMDMREESSESESSTETLENGIIQDIMGHSIRTHGQEMQTIGTLICDIVGDPTLSHYEEKMKALSAYGIRVSIPDGEYSGTRKEAAKVYFASRYINSKILTKEKRDLGTILGRIPGSVKRLQRKFNGINLKCTEVPYAEIFSMEDEVLDDSFFN